MKQPQEQKRLRAWLLLFVVSLASVVQAEDVQVTTYYPSPRGNYQTLNSTGQTNLATGTAATDRVGIGTTDPGAKLDVNGTVRLGPNGVYDNWFPYSDDNAYVTGANVFLRGGSPQGWVNVAQVTASPPDMYVNGQRVCRADGTGCPAGGGVNPGTANYVAKYDGAGTNITNSSLFDNGNVGIGTTGPAAKLDVDGTVRLGPNGVYDNWFPWTDNNAYVTGANIYLRGGSPQGWVTVAQVTASPPDMYVNGQRVCRQDGTGCPSGSGGGTGRLYKGTNITFSDGSGSWNPSDGDKTINASGGGGGGVNPGTANYVAKYDGAGTNITNSSLFDNGNVGIGTTTPQRRLEVNSAMRLTNSSANLDDGVIGTALWAAGLNIVGINTDGGGRKINEWGSIIQNENPVGNTFTGTTNMTGDAYVAGQRVCRADGTGCPAAAVNPAWNVKSSGTVTGSGSASATCDTGYFATGGGIVDAGTNFTSVFNMSSYHSGSDSRVWHCDIAGSGSGVWNCQAMCMRFPN